VSVGYFLVGGPPAFLAGDVSRPEVHLVFYSGAS